MKISACNIKNQFGVSQLFAVIAMLSVMIISFVIFEFVRLNTIASTCRSKFEDALVTLSVENYVETYASVREAYASSYSYHNGYWINANNVSKRNIENEILSALNNGEISQITSISNLNFTVTEAQDNSSRFVIKGSCTITFPYVFFYNGDFSMNLSADTYWQAQF